MIKNLFFLILIIFFSGCSVDNKTGIWSKKNKNLAKSKNEKILFEEKESFNEEFNQNLLDTN